MANEIVPSSAGDSGDNSEKLSLEVLNRRFNRLEETVNKLGADHNRFKREFREFKEDSHIDGAMQDDITKAVKAKGVQVMGGKKSEAYKNRGLRQKVYIDIYAEIKRQCGLVRSNGKYLGYKHLPVKNFEMALNVIESYEPPISLENEILGLNEVTDLIED